MGIISGVIGVIAGAIPGASNPQSQPTVQPDYTAPSRPSRRDLNQERKYIRHELKAERKATKHEHKARQHAAKAQLRHGRGASFGQHQQQPNPVQQVPTGYREPVSRHGYGVQVPQQEYGVQMRAEDAAQGGDLPPPGYEQVAGGTLESCGERDPKA